MSSPRRSKRSRTKPPVSEYRNVAMKTTLWGELKNTVSLKKMVSIIENAKDIEIEGLGQEWSPLVWAVLICGSSSTRNGNRRELEDELIRFIALCKERGVSVDGKNSAHMIPERLYRPLVVAAYYGLHRSVKQLLEAGASPDLGDGEGKTALHAALLNPFSRDKLRECDRLTAEVLFDLDIVTSDLGAWIVSPPGSKIYINGDCFTGSAMVNAIRNRNMDAAVLLLRHGAGITDRDYLSLLRLKGKRVDRHLLPFVAKVAATNSTNSVSVYTARTVASWRPEVDWSFPPTWKVTIALCRSCGLPESIFKEHVIPCLPRHWFYTSQQLDGPVPLRLGPSLGELDMRCRRAGWSREPVVNTTCYTDQL